MLSMCWNPLYLLGIYLNNHFGILFDIHFGVLIDILIDIIFHMDFDILFGNRHLTSYGQKKSRNKPTCLGRPPRV
jgi:hypothetical protein